MVLLHGCCWLTKGRKGFRWSRKSSLGSREHIGLKVGCAGYTRSSDFGGTANELVKAVTMRRVRRDADGGGHGSWAVSCFPIDTGDGGRRQLRGVIRICLLFLLPGEAIQGFPHAGVD